MRKLALAIGMLVAIGVATFAAMPAAAATTVSVSMTLAESANPLRAGWPGSEPCPDIGLDVNCGTGEVIPFGHATEIVSIGACGETCSLRWIILAQGVILLRETAGDFSCPGACVSQWPHGSPIDAPLTAVVAGGTGIFEGASGTLTGTVRAAAFQAQIKYAGTLTLAQ
jgi:hypothetical protein